MIISLILTHVDKSSNRSSTLAELVDVMPTVAELANIEVPNKKKGDKKHPIEGKSLVGAIKGDDTVKTAAFSQQVCGFQSLSSFDHDSST